MTKCPPCWPEPPRHALCAPSPQGLEPVEVLAYPLGRRQRRAVDEAGVLRGACEVPAELVAVKDKQVKVELARHLEEGELRGGEQSAVRESKERPYGVASGHEAAVGRGDKPPPVARGDAELLGRRSQLRLCTPKLVERGHVYP